MTVQQSMAASIAAGICIIPIDARTKKPFHDFLPRDPQTRKPTWKPYQLGFPHPNDVQTWQQGGVQAFAAIGGAVSGGLLVIDFDEDGFYDRWRAEVGDLADGLPVQRTGGGGYQVFCRCPDPGLNDQFAFVQDDDPKNAAGRRVAIESRGEGGYAIVPPSLHPSGNRYEWIAGDITTIPTIGQAKADALVAAARKLDQCPLTRKQREKFAAADATSERRRAAVRAKLNGQGSVIDAFNEAHDVTDILEQHGYQWRGNRMIRPGAEKTSEPGVWITERNGHRVSFHHSSNDPLKNGHTHDAFSAFYHLEHGGDYRRAVKAAAGLLGMNGRNNHAVPPPSNAPTDTPGDSGEPDAQRESEGEGQGERPPPAAAVEEDGYPTGPNIIRYTEPLRFAEHFLAREYTDAAGRLEVRKYRGEWWKFARCGYSPLTEDGLNAQLYRHLDKLWTPTIDKEGFPTGELTKIVAKSATVREVIGALVGCGTLIEGGEMPQWLGRQTTPPENIVAFRNGLLDTEAYRQGETRLMRPTPEWFSTAACPYDFDVAAKCPLWLTFLHQVFEDDPDSVALLQEWFGLQLIPDNRYERLMMLVGKRRAGKGTVIRLLTAMLGDQQLAYTNFTKLASRFGLHPLLGRLAAVMADASISRSTDSAAALEVLKGITGGDEQAIDRKGISEMPKVKLNCRFTIAVNELPKLPDSAGTLKPRLLLLYFGRSFAGQEDTTLKERLPAEAPGVAVWALEGLCRLRENGRFTAPARCHQMVEEFERMVSPVRSFLHERCEVAAGHWVPKANLYGAWEAFCQERGDEPGNTVQFGTSLVNASPDITARRRGPRGQQFTTYEGVRLCP